VVWLPPVKWGLPGAKDRTMSPAPRKCTAVRTRSGAPSMRNRPAGMSMIPPARRVTASIAATNAAVESDPPVKSAAKSSTTSTIMVEPSLSASTRFRARSASDIVGRAGGGGIEYRLFECRGSARWYATPVNLNTGLARHS
jgi:hypothetical protein